ncbi:MAG TPA: hypothetical protein VFC86_00860 [Planctomycetota bacterium]|nr:hypothetical protein [Planctomycetota bacterium]
MSLLLIGMTAAAIQADRFGQESTRAYTEARHAADRLEEDLLSCFPFTGAQTFTMDEGPTNRLSFIATTLVGTTHQSARITYFLDAQGGVERRTQ